MCYIRQQAELMRHQSELIMLGVVGMERVVHRTGYLQNNTTGLRHSDMQLSCLFEAHVLTTSKVISRRVLTGDSVN